MGANAWNEIAAMNRKRRQAHDAAIDYLRAVTRGPRRSGGLVQLSIYDGPGGVPRAINDATGEPVDLAVDGGAW